MNNKTKKLTKETYAHIDYKTNIFGKTNYEILQSLKGDITDGYWENSWKLNNIMKNIEFIINDDNEIIIRSSFINKDEQEIRTFLAKCLKLLMKAYLKANPEAGKFNKDNTAKINNWFHKQEPLICEVYDLYRLLLNKSVNSDVLEENLNESLLTEAPEKHDTLNPKLWNIETNTLKPEVKEKIMQIVKDFCDDLENDEIKFNLKDVKLVGSNCSYNYNDKSDLDIHLVMDTKSLKCPDNLYPLLYSAYRSIWNKNHDIDFYGIPVEIFVETDDTEDMNSIKDKDSSDNKLLADIQNPENLAESLSSFPYEMKNLKFKDFNETFLHNAISDKQNYETASDGDNYYIYKRENHRLKHIMSYISAFRVLCFLNFDYLNELENVDSEFVEALHPEIDLGWMGKGKRHLVDADTFTTKNKNDTIDVEISKDLPTLKYIVKDDSYLDDEAAKDSWYNDAAATYNPDVDSRREFNDALNKLIKDKVDNAIKATIKPEYTDSGLYVNQGGISGVLPIDISLEASTKKRIPELINDKDEIIENINQSSKSLSEAKLVNNVAKMTCGYITDDGKLLELDEYHGEDKSINNLNYIEFSNTHPEDDTCVRIYKEPTDKQYIELEKIIDKYLEWENYCKVEILENKHSYNYYNVFSLFDDACSNKADDKEIVGNWTGYKLVKIIKDYFNENRNLKECLDKINLSESLSEDEKEFLLNLIEELDAEEYLDERFSNNCIAIKKDKISEFKEEYRHVITDEYIDIFSSLLYPKTWEYLNDFDFDHDNTFWDSRNITHITIPNSVTNIGRYAFSWCKSLQSITIPNSVTIIDAYAFYECKSLKSITIPNSVTSIGESAFYECKSLQSITIPNSVTNIGRYAFYECKSLKSIILENRIDDKIVDQLRSEYPDIKIVLEENLNESLLTEAPEKNNNLILDCVYGKAWEISRDPKSVADSGYIYIIIQTPEAIYSLTLEDKEIVAFSKAGSNTAIYSFVMLLINDKNLYEICKKLNYTCTECNDDCFALANDFFEKFQNNFKKSFELLNKIISYTKYNLYEYDEDIEHSTILLFVRDPVTLVDNLEAEAKWLDDDEAKDALQLAKETEEFLLPDELVECSTLRNL